jgi:acyl-CoA synthetase (AMP-forming)/AMP-acid ligase II
LPVCDLLCVLARDIDRPTSGSNFPLHIFKPDESTIPALINRYPDSEHETIRGQHTEPSNKDTAVYLFTSSASSVSNLKAVPIRHEVLTTGAASRIEWLKSEFPHQSFNRLRVLSWAPWSHIFGLSNDVGAWAFLASGCLVFMAVPPSYLTTVDFALATMDIPNRAVHAIMNKNVDALAGVPWLLDGMMATWLQEQEPGRKEKLTAALRNMRVLSFGGAPSTESTTEWALNLGLNLVHDIGMTELGRK